MQIYQEGEGEQIILYCVFVPTIIFCSSIRSIDEAIRTRRGGGRLIVRTFQSGSPAFGFENENISTTQGGQCVHHNDCDTNEQEEVACV